MSRQQIRYNCYNYLADILRGRKITARAHVYISYSMGKEIGKVIHWYDKIGVAVVKLKSTLKVGDKVKVTRGDEEYEDTVTSPQLDHKDISSAKTGDDAAIKLSQKTKEGSTISIVE